MRNQALAAGGWRSAVLHAALCILPLSLPALADDQPQWGVIHSRNLVSAEKNLPASFDADKQTNLKWIAKLGNETHAVPIVADGRIYIGTNNGSPRDPKHMGDRGVLFCLDEKTGDLLWQLVVPKIDDDVYKDWPRGGIVGPVTVEGDRVYVVTNRGEVACLDVHGLANGNDGPYQDEARHMTPSRSGQAMPLGPLDADILWLFDTHKETGSYPHDAAHCSPLLDGDLLYINTSNGVDNTHRKIRAPEAPSLIVLDKKTGRLVAQDKEMIGPNIFHCTWSSPAMGIVNGQKLVFFGGGDGILYAFEALAQKPADGQVQTLKRIWKYDGDPEWPRENVHRWVGNRRESPSNIMAMPVFHEGRVYIVLGGDMWWGKHQSWVKCVDAATGREIWSHAMKRSSSTVAISGDLVFAADSTGVIHCLDRATGKPHWTHTAGGEAWGSPYVADEKVYFGTHRGELTVMAASTEKRLLATIDLGSRMSSTATAANGVLYIATYDHLFATQLKEPPAAAGQP
jgi:outer membrane protein assembly factor BamB